MCFSFSYSLSICLFIQRVVKKRSASHHLFLFTYANCLLIACAFRFNIHYLFVYLFKAMSTKAGGSDHLFLFTYGNHLLLIMVFVLIFIIYYLFIQSDVNKSRWKRPPVFIYLWKSLVVRHGFRLNIQYLFIYLFKAISTKAGGTDHLYLLTPITCCETWFSFENSVTIYLFIQNDVNKSRWKRPPVYMYFFLNQKNSVCHILC